MIENQEKINLLLEKLDSLFKKQEFFQKEINDLRLEINNLKSLEVKTGFHQEQPKTISEIIQIEPELKNVDHPVLQSAPTKAQPQFPFPKENKLPEIKSDIEKFIGENLINKIGIAITVIGVGIGAKYAIDHQLISPWTRIILGYMIGLGLLGFAVRLKKSYENFSSVLLSGSMAILYFITYSAFAFYGLISQVFAFTLMVLITVFTVISAIRYNRQVIAIIGLVGAYAVPFLLSEGSSNVAFLFSYMAIINVGILVIAFHKYWKPLYYSSYIITWLMFLSWYNSKYQTSEHFVLSLTFLFIFFATFYLTFLAYKLIQKEKFEIEDILALLANSSVFYCIGYSIFSIHPTGKHLLGFFTLCNAMVHFAVSVIIYRQKLADRMLFYLVAGLALVFITIAIPVQLDGNWVTLLWTCEAALLFSIGRTKNASFYEKLSYAIMLLAFSSIIHDWIILNIHYNPEQPGSGTTPVFNIQFLTSIIFIAAFTLINILYNSRKFLPPLIPQKTLSEIITFSIPAILLIVIFYTLRLEISNFWNNQYLASTTEIKKAGLEYTQNFRGSDLNNYKTIWIINYSLLFLTIISFVNNRKIKNSQWGLINLGLSSIAVIVFLLHGLYVLSELRASYLNPTLPEYYHPGSFNIGIRYVSFVFIGLMLGSIIKYTRQDIIKTDLKIACDFLLHISLLWILSSELIHWMDIYRSSQSYKLGLSILWGVYALLLVALGIWKKKKHLRIGAIVLFTGTLIKLFFYDISHLDTIPKTIVFVCLGILLLIISFLYHKYKHLISEENKL